METVKPRIAFVMSHPIQNFCPQFVSLGRSPLWEIRVFFATSAGAKPYYDKQFGKVVSWSGLDLSFDHRFLNHGEDIKINGAIDAPDLDAELDTFDPDAVVVYGYGKKVNRRAYNWARRKHKAIVYQADSELRHARQVLRRALKRLYLPRFFRHVDAFLTVGDANERYLEHYGADPRADPGRFVRSSFPINVNQFAPAFAKRHDLAGSIRDKYEIDDDEVVLCVVGKLIGIKAQDKLIEAVHILDTSETKIVLLIVGSGPDEARLRELSRSVQRNRVIFAGFVNVDELPAYYACTDIYVHPSRVEAHSLSISEAMFMGCPLVISDKCGSWGSVDDLRPGVNGLVYPTEDSRALAAAIERVARNRALREWFGKNSRKMAIASQETIHESLYSVLINLGLIHR